MRNRGRVRRWTRYGAEGGCRRKMGEGSRTRGEEKISHLLLKAKSQPLKHPTLLLSQLVLCLVWTDPSVMPVTDKWPRFRNKLNVQRT